MQKLTPTCQSTIRNYLFGQFKGGADGNYYFRRCGKITFKENPINKKIVSPTAIPIILPNLNGVTSDEIKKNIQIDCKSFSGITTTHAIRTELACTLNVPILFHSFNYNQPNLGFPYGVLREVITPAEGDLLCLWISNKTIEKRKSFKLLNPSLEADSWFIASDQLLRAFTLITYEWHDSFNTIIPKNTPAHEKENALRKKLFIGNTLMTNGWLKHKLALEQSHLEPMTDKESQEKYWHLRTEPASRNWVDIYAAIVLMARYGEVPNSSNVPNNNNAGPRRIQWSLPLNFLEQYNIELLIEDSESSEEYPPFEYEDDVTSSIEIKEIDPEELEIKIQINLAPRDDFRFYKIALDVDWHDEK